MTTAIEAAKCYAAPELDRLRASVEELVLFAEEAAPTDRERQRWVKALETIRDRLEEVLDASA